MTESEWKLFSQLREVALDRFCQRVLSEIDGLASDAGKSNHERYLAVFQLLNRRDTELANTFDRPRRSTALLQLTLMWSLHLLTEDELSRFQQKTRESVLALVD